MPDVHPYFTAKARAVMYDAGGDPDDSGPLAAWAEQARQTNDQGRGVIVAQDGEIIAETHSGGLNRSVRATYVTREDARRYGLTATELGMALGALRRITGRRLIHVSLGDAASGASKFIPQV